VADAQIGKNFRFEAAESRAPARSGAKFKFANFADLKQSHARPRRCKSQGCQISDNPSGGAGAAFRGISQRHGLSGGALAVMGLPGVHGVSERGGASMRLPGALVQNS